jgi:Fic family protein
MFDALEAWEKYLHSDVKEPLLIQCALMHYQFEAIHPFIDDNGRVGRLLITFFLCERGILSQPLLYLSAFFERYRDEYYRRLLAVSQKGDWREWIEFFLRGVAVQAQEALEGANQILDLHDKYRAMLGERRVPQAAMRLIEHLFVSPVVSVARLSEIWEMPFPAVQRGVERLAEIGILSEMTGQRRNRLYVAHELLRVLGTDRAERKSSSDQSADSSGAVQ